MSEFDPYLKWLGIREKNLPINHYRLLGLDLFEDDPDVISMAADRQMTHIRTYQSGPHGDLSQQLLNELARARRCLLMADKKAEYDAQLNAALSQPVHPSVPESPDEVAVPVAQVIEASVVNQVQTPIVQPNVVPSSTDSSEKEFAVTELESSPEMGIRTQLNVRARTKKRENKQLVWGIFGWVSGGLAAIGIAAALIGSGFIGGVNPDYGEDNVPVVKSPKETPDEPSPSGDKGTNDVNQSKPKSKPQPGQPNPRKEPVIPVVETAAPTSELFYPESFESQFKLTNLATYPKADPSSFGVFGEVKRGLQDKKTVPFEQSALAVGSLVRVTPDAGAVLIGLAFTTDKDLHISAVRPIFHDGFQAFAGNVIGSRTFDASIMSGDDPIIAIAKPGFAVGEIDVSAVNPVRCFRFKYMRIGKQKLDTSDVYFSKWFGRETGPRRTIRNENGLPVVGIYGSLSPSGSLATLSLVGMDSNGKPENANVAVSPKIELPKFLDSDKTEMPDDGTDPFAVDSSISNSVAKFPEPSTRQRTAARKNLPDSIQLVIDQATDVRSRILAARELIKAAETQNEMLLTYVILKEAEEMGVSAGDAQSAVDALRGIDQSFEIDFWKDVQKTIDKASRYSSSVTALDFKNTMDELIEEAKQKAEFDAAGKLLSAAIKLAKRARDADSTSEYLRLEREIRVFENLTEDSDKALLILATNPDDPVANLDQGDFLFLLKDDLDGALEHWSKSGDKKRVELVEMESQCDDSDGSQIAELADAWREFGKSNRTPRDRRSLGRAFDLYRKASRLLSGVEKQAVEEKMKEVSQIAGD